MVFIIIPSHKKDIAEIKCHISVIMAKQVTFLAGLCHLSKVQRGAQPCSLSWHVYDSHHNDVMFDLVSGRSGRRVTDHLFKPIW